MAKLSECSTCYGIISDNIGCACDYGGRSPILENCLECGELNERDNLDRLSRCEDCIKKSNLYCCMSCNNLTNKLDMGFKNGKMTRKCVNCSPELKIPPKPTKPPKPSSKFKK